MTDLDLDALADLEAEATAASERTDGQHVLTMRPHEVLALIAAARNARPCDGGCSYNDGPQEDCSLHGRSPADLWQMLITACADRDAAQAALARLTDEAMERRLTEALFDTPLIDGYDWIGTSSLLPTAEEIRAEVREVAVAVLSTIRAVAGEGQEAGE